MTDSMVITNLLVPADEWYEFKNFAGELGVSVNILINKLIRKVNVQKSFVSDLKHDSIWDLPELAKMPNKPMGASEEDKIIYGI